MTNKKITIGLDFDVNLTELNKLKDQLNLIQRANESSGTKYQLTEELKQAAKAAEQLEQILNDAWNPKLGQLDLSKFNTSIKSAYGSISNLKQILEAEPQLGARTFNNLSKAVINTNTQMKQSNKLLDSMATSMANTVKWGITSSIFNKITGSLQKAWDYSLKLDSSLNDIRIVTGKSADEMERFARVANASAKDLRASTLDYTQAALIYYQQGLGEEEVQTRANTTLKVANVTGQSGQAVSEQLTAVWNGYKVAAEEAELYIDKLSAVAATTAADLEELSTGMSKVASAANAMGVDVDQLNAQLATIISVTRQAPESVGTALKTIYARMGDIEAGITDDGVTLGDYTEKMAEMGVHVLNAKGELRDMGEVIEEVGNNWNNFSREQQIALAQTMAGTRQYNNLIALFDSWEMYEDALNSSKNSAGELQRQQDIYMESTEAYLQRLATEAENTYDILFDDSAIKTMTASLTGLLGLFNSLLAGTGGGLSSLAFLGASATSMFSSQLGRGINQIKYNKAVAKAERESLAEKKEWLKPESVPTNSQEAKKRVEIFSQVAEASTRLNENEQKTVQNLAKQTLERNKQLEIIEKMRAAADAAGIDTEVTVDELTNKASFEMSSEQYSEAAQERASVEGFLNNRLLAFPQLIDMLATSRREAQNAQGTYDVLQMKKPSKISEEKWQKYIEASQKYSKEETERALKDAEQEVKETILNLQSWREDIISMMAELHNIDINDLSKDMQKAMNNMIDELLDTSKVLTEEDLVKIIEKTALKIKNQRNNIENAKKTISTGLEELGKNNNVSVGDYAEKVTAERNVKYNEMKGLLSKAFEEDKIASQIRGWSTIITTATGLLGILKGINEETLTWSQLLTTVGTIAVQIAINFKDLQNTFIYSKEQLQALGKWFLRWTGLSAKMTAGTSLGFKEITKSILGAKVGLKGFSIPLGKLGLIIAAITIVVKALNKALYAEERAAEAAAKSAGELKQAYQDVSDAFKELTTTIENYQGAKMALDEMVTGTEKWDAAVKQLNQDVLQLIDAYPQLAKETNIKNGVLEISQEGIDTYLKKEEQKVFAAEMASLIAESERDRTQWELDSKNLRKGIEYEDAGAGVAAATIAAVPMITAGAGIGSMIAPGPGTIIGAGIAAIADIGFGIAMGNLDEPVFNNLEQDTFNLLLKEVNNTNGAILENKDELAKFGITNENAIKALQEAKEDMLILADELDANTKAQEVRQQQIAQSYLKTNSSQYQLIDEQNIKDAVSAMTGTALTEAKNNVVLSDDLDKIYRDYAAKRDWETTNIKKENGFAVFSIVDKEGNPLEYTIGDEQIKDFLKTQAALSMLSVQVDDYVEVVDKIRNLTDDKEVANALIAMAGGKDFDTSAFSPDQIEDVKKIIQNLDLEQLDGDFLTQFGFLPEKDELGNIVKTSEQLFEEALNRGPESYDASEYWQNLLKTSQNSILALDEFFAKLQAGESIEEQTFIGLETKYKQYLDTLVRGSHEYLQVLRQIRELEEQNTLEALNAQAEEYAIQKDEKLKEIQEITDKIALYDFAGADTTKMEQELKNRLEELDDILEKWAQKDREIEFQIKADLQSDVDNAFGMAKEFNELQSLLSDDLELSFEEARQVIAKGYGEILQDAQETSSNSIKLNTDVKDAFIKNERAKMKESKDNKIKELEDRNIMLESQKGILEEELKLLERALTTRNEDRKLEFLAAAMLKDKEYQFEVDKMQETLKANDIQNKELTGQEKKLFDALGIMYSDDLSNQEKYGGESDTIWSRLFSNIASYASEAFGGINLLWRKIQGEDVSWKDIAGAFFKGIKEEGEDFSVRNTYEESESERLKAAKDELSKLVEQYRQDLGEDDFNLDEVIKARRKVVQVQIDELEAQIGANDAGIAALKSSWESLEAARANAGTEAYQKELEKEKDLYHDINIEITKLENELKKLQKEQEKLTGQDLIDNLNAQTEALNKQADAIRRKIDINAEYEKKYLKGLLAEQGVLFEAETGDISNYDTIFEKHYTYLQELQRQEFATENKDAKQTISNLLAQAEEDFDKMTKYMSRYDELTTNDIPSWEEAYQDSLDQAIEKNIQKFNMEIDLRIETSEAERDWNEFKKNVIDNIDEDDILGNAKASLQDFHSYYKDGFEGVVQVNTDHVNDILFELREMDRGIESKYYGDNRTKALEDLKTYYAQLMEDLTAVDELSEQVRQSYLDMMDEAQAEFDKQIASYEQITNLIDHDLKLLELLGGEKNYKSFSHYYDAQVENNKKQLDFQRQQVEFWKEEMDNADEGSERWLKAKENLESTTIAWRELTNKSIEDVQAKYLNAIKLIFEELNNEITSGKGLEYIKEEWDLITKNSEKYLDNINAAYGIEQLRNKYQEAIDNTDSISAQEQLNDLMAKEIAALEEKDKLTEYDVERANKRYEIALKQIALEEAQQNKTSMKLKRDSQGNYSYVFTADEDAVSKAEDELADAQNALYNFDKENYLNNLDELYAAYEEYQEKMLEAAQINDPEERAQKELLINEQYGELINGLTEQNQNIRNNLYESAFEELARLQDKNAESFKNMTQTQKDALMNDLIPQWESGIQQMADKFAGEGGLEEVCKGAMEQISEATQQYKTDLEEVEETSGLAFDKIEQGTDTAIQETQNLIIENEDLIETYEDELEAIQDVITELDTLIEKFAEAEQAAKDAAEAAYYYTRNEDYDSADAAFGDRDYSLEMTRAIVSGEDLEGEHYTSSARRREKKIGGMEVKVDNKRLDNLFAAYIAGDEKARFVVMEVYNGRANYTDEFLNKYGFNTGGYTGSWSGDEGRLALLHQKELVLNANDTQNILNAVQIIRSVEGSLLRRMSEMTSNIGNVYSIAENKETLEQNVHIEANFPNVTNSKEVENAIDNLINIAAQRTHRDIK